MQKKDNEKTCATPEVPGFLSTRKTDTAKYYYYESLGRGAQGVVWSINRAKDEKRFALKIKKVKEGERGEDDNELQYLEQLRHFACLQIEEAFCDDGYLFIVTEYCDAGSLHHLLGTASLKVGKSIGVIAFQILTGLHYLHSTMNLIHGDMKPENVLVCQNAIVKIGDFGLSSRFASMESILSVLPLGPCCASRKRRCGTLEYMAPEVARGSPPDPASDMWAFGAILGECLKGKRLFPAKNLVEHINLVEGQPEIIKASYRQCNTLAMQDPKSPSLQQLVEIIDRLLDKDPSKRPTSTQLLQEPFFKDAGRQFIKKMEMHFWTRFRSEQVIWEQIKNDLGHQVGTEILILDGGSGGGIAHQSHSPLSFSTSERIEVKELSMAPVQLAGFSSQNAAGSMLQPEMVNSPPPPAGSRFLEHSLFNFQTIPFSTASSHVPKTQKVCKQEGNLCSTADGRLPPFSFFLEPKGYKKYAIHLTKNYFILSQERHCSLRSASGDRSHQNDRIAEGKEKECTERTWRSLLGHRDTAGAAVAYLEKRGVKDCTTSPQEGAGQASASSLPQGLPKSSCSGGRPSADFTMKREEVEAGDMQRWDDVGYTREEWGAPDVVKREKSIIPSDAMGSSLFSTPDYPKEVALAVEMEETVVGKGSRGHSAISLSHSPFHFPYHDSPCVGIEVSHFSSSSISSSPHLSQIHVPSFTYECGVSTAEGMLESVNREEEEGRQTEETRGKRGEEGKRTNEEPKESLPTLFWNLSDADDMGKEWPFPPLCSAQERQVHHLNERETKKALPGLSTKEETRENTPMEERDTARHAASLLKIREGYYTGYGSLERDSVSVESKKRDSEGGQFTTRVSGVWKTSDSMSASFAVLQVSAWMRPERCYEGDARETTMSTPSTWSVAAALDTEGGAREFLLRSEDHWMLPPLCHSSSTAMEDAVLSGTKRACSTPCLSKENTYDATRGAFCTSVPCPPSSLGHLQGEQKGNDNEGTERKVEGNDDSWWNNSILQEGSETPKTRGMAGVDRKEKQTHSKLSSLRGEWRKENEMLEEGCAGVFVSSDHGVSECEHQKEKKRLVSSSLATENGVAAFHRIYIDLRNIVCLPKSEGRFTFLVKGEVLQVELQGSQEKSFPPFFPNFKGTEVEVQSTLANGPPLCQLTSGCSTLSATPCIVVEPHTTGTAPSRATRSFSAHPTTASPYPTWNASLVSLRDRTKEHFCSDGITKRRPSMPYPLSSSPPSSSLMANTTGVPRSSAPSSLYSPWVVSSPCSSPLIPSSPFGYFSSCCEEASSVTSNNPNSHYTNTYPPQNHSLSGSVGMLFNPSVVHQGVEPMSNGSLFPTTRVAGAAASTGGLGGVLPEVTAHAQNNFAVFSNSPLFSSPPPPLCCYSYVPTQIPAPPSDGSVTSSPYWGPCNSTPSALLTSPLNTNLLGFSDICTPLRPGRGGGGTSEMCGPSFVMLPPSSLPFTSLPSTPQRTSIPPTSPSLRAGCTERDGNARLNPRSPAIHCHSYHPHRTTGNNAGSRMMSTAGTTNPYNNNKR